MSDLLFEFFELVGGLLPEQSNHPTTKGHYYYVMTISVLCSGTSLIVTDLIMDVRLVLASTPCQMNQRRRQTLDYYLFLLRPRLSPFPFPGYFFVVLCSFYLLVLEPSIHHYAMAICYLPICGRYREMLLHSTTPTTNARGSSSDHGHPTTTTTANITKGQYHALRDWQYIVGIRFMLLALGITSLQLHHHSTTTMTTNDMNDTTELLSLSSNNGGGAMANSSSMGSANIML
jgi:hypothetical protein